ncbi:MAG TPA: endonuclease/exonuclease/phosphatase family protein [Cyclobacteriaceae bacterium]|nr:endonuclease/exonuclease/phosphatase family protein [Cyclobacteriaceae bacterium]
MRNLILLALFFSLTDSQAQSIKIMTYNIRYDNPGDGVNAWPKRIEKVTGLIRKHNPDVIGVQEALHHQLEDLVKVLPDYSYVGVGRDDGKKKGEYSAILFRNSRFGLLSDSTLWLSETPQVPGSKSWDAAITRLVTIAKFFDKELKTDFIVLNTHFDHIGKEARLNSGAQIAGIVASSRTKVEIPILVTGDFNCERSEEAYRNVTIKDLTDTKPANDSTGTYCGFEVGKMECKPIDYIFYTKEWLLKNYLVITDNDGTHYPSDHLPVMTEFELSLVK